MRSDVTNEPARAWLMVAMLFAFMLLNFVDKAVLGVSAVPIMRELGLNHTQFGLIGASFFAFFSLGAIIIGFVVNWFPTKWALAAMALIWSLCQLPMTLGVGVAGLVASRVMLGLGERPAYPVAVHAILKWFPNHRGAVPTSLIAMGGSVGAGVIAPAIVFVIVVWSWHAAFGLLGLVGILWTALWLAVGREGGPAAADLPGADSPRTHVPYRLLLCCRTVIGVQLITFCAYWLLALMIVWLPAYLAEGRGYKATAIGWIVALPALLQVFLIPGICIISDSLKMSGRSSKAARGGIAAGCALAAGVLTTGLPLMETPTLSIARIAIAFSIGGVIFVIGPVLIAEVTPHGSAAQCSVSPTGSRHWQDRWRRLLWTGSWILERTPAAAFGPALSLQAASWLQVH